MLRVVLVLAALICTLPLPLAAQSGSEFRPYAFVLLAYAAAWILIGLWAFSIGRRLKRLESAPPRAGGSDP